MTFIESATILVVKRKKVNQPCTGFNVEITSMQQQNVLSTLKQHLKDVMWLLVEIRLKRIAVSFPVSRLKVYLHIVRLKVHQSQCHNGGRSRDISINGVSFLRKGIKKYLSRKQILEIFRSNTKVSGNFSWNKKNLKKQYENRTGSSVVLCIYLFTIIYPG